MFFSPPLCLYPRISQEALLDFGAILVVVPSSTGRSGRHSAGGAEETAARWRPCTSDTTSPGGAGAAGAGLLARSSPGVVATVVPLRGRAAMPLGFSNSQCARPPSAPALQRAPRSGLYRSRLCAPAALPPVIPHEITAHLAMWRRRRDLTVGG